MSRDWPRYSLDHLVALGVVQLGRGKVISKTDLAKHPGPYPVYSSAKNNDGKFGEYGKFMFDEELITWSVDGGGRLFYRPQHKFSITNVGGFIKIKKPDRVIYPFLYYCLSLLHSKINFDWVRKAHPSVIRKLYTDIPLPSVTEQKRIVAILDEAFAGIDTAIANTEKNLANARELFESYVNQAFINANEAWSKVKLSNVINIAHGFAFKSAQFHASNDLSQPIVLTPGNYTEEGELSFTSKNTKRLTTSPPKEFVFNPGDLTIVMTDLSSKMKILGKPAFVAADNVLHNQRIGRVVFKEDFVRPRYLYYFLMSRNVTEEIKRTATGTMVKHTAPKRVLCIDIVFPKDKSRQDALIESLDSLRAETQRLGAIYQKKLRSLDELKQSLLHKAFSGELTAKQVEAEAKEAVA